MGNDLCKAMAAGDPTAYREVCDRHATPMLRTALRLLNSRHDAEDVVQEVFVGLARNQNRLGQVNNLRAYLFASLRHEISRSQQKKLRLTTEELTDLPADQVPATQAEDEREMLWKLAEQLPADQREVLVLKIQGELTFREIGVVCEISLETAASRYRYAMEKLKKLSEMLR